MLDLYTLSNGKDIYLARHHTGTTFCAIGIALAAGLDTHAVSILQTAGMVHDVGKIGIPLSILQKTEKLTDDEWLIIRQHAVVGAEIYTQQYSRIDKYVKEVALAVKHHHERWDGKGYPDGLRGEQIPLTSRVLAIADSFDAMTSGRPYKKPMDAVDAVRELERNAGIMYDPALVLVAVEVLKTINVYSFSLFQGEQKQKQKKGDDKFVNFG